MFYLSTNATLGPKLGPLQIPVLAYSFALCLMGALTCGLSKTAGLGGLTFLASDFIIILKELKLDFKGRGTVVYITYVIA